MGPLRQSQAQKIIGSARICPRVDGPTKCSRYQGYVLHLVWSARCGVLWAVKAKWNHHMGSVSNAIDAFDPSIGGETATTPRETRQSYPPAWQWSASCRKTGQDILGNAEMGGLTSHAVLYIRYSFRIPFGRSMAHGLAHQHLRSYEEVKKWIVSWIVSKDASFFLDGIR